MTILCYHAVEPEWTSPLSVTPEAFADQIAWLARHRRVVDVATAAALSDRGRLPRATSAITFDDGFSSVYEHALPVLRRHRVPAMVFVVAETIEPSGRAVDWVDTPPEWPLRTLTLDQLLELEDAGVSVGSHSYSHRVLTELTEAECIDDLRRSRDVLSDALGRAVDHLAYPRGFHDERVRRAAATAGFRASFTLPESPEPTGPHAIPRVGVYPGNGTGALRMKSRHAYLRFRTGRLYPTARRLLKGSPPPTRRAG